MRLEDLTAYEDFCALDRDALSAVRRNTRIISVPPCRWLLRGGRKLTGRYYLLEGCVERDSEAVTAPYHQRLYPGCASLRSIKPTVLARVDWDAVEFLFSDQLSSASEGDAGWEERFLATPLMQKLSLSDWNRVLSALTRVPVKKGTRVVCARNRPDDHCYVLASGIALAGSGGRVTRRVAPGELFGDTALVSGLHPETVAMATNGAVLRLPEKVFVEVVLEAAIAVRLTAPDAVSLHVPINQISGVIDELNTDTTYAIASGRPAERLLAALTLVKCGIDACVVLQAGTVRPSAQVRRLAMDSACSTDKG